MFRDLFSPDFVLTQRRRPSSQIASAVPADELYRLNHKPYGPTRPTRFWCSHPDGTVP
jgi:hypothetical protein